ncbi:hypothetical protein ACFWBX_08170 [Streptomyces sp. NPDC059991]|uniref:hypothetical protein n=1 Tax=Streptomyces sp. NPDC059991 TaxID=3347028 RepID=UPI0036CE0A1B
MVTLLRDRADDGGAWYASSAAGVPSPAAGQPDASSRLAEARSGDAASEEAESAVAGQVRLRLDQAVDQLVAARSVEAAARRAVADADAEAQRDASARRGVEIRLDAAELT